MSKGISQEQFSQVMMKLENSLNFAAKDGLPVHRWAGQAKLEYSPHYKL